MHPEASEATGCLASKSRSPGDSGSESHSAAAGPAGPGRGPAGRSLSESCHGESTMTVTVNGPHLEGCAII
jgi:hypothetical protein